MLSYEDIRDLPLPDLALKLLGTLDREQANFNNLIQGRRYGGSSAQAQPADLERLLARLSDAWAWLEAHALIGPSSQNPHGSTWQRQTSLGQELVKDPRAVAKVWAAERLAGDLDPALSSARANFVSATLEN